MIAITAKPTSHSSTGHSLSIVFGRWRLFVPPNVISTSSAIFVGVKIVPNTTHTESTSCATSLATDKIQAI